jgi:hypothetical protein
MKIKYFIKLTCFALLLVCWQNVNAQNYTKRTPVLDTSKIDYEIVNPKKIHRYYYLNIVNEMYFYNFDTTKAIRITDGIPYSGELGGLQNFESTKKYRYRITDNETFNSLLPECDFYYELTEYGKERVIAQYNGKFFRYEDFNYLMREMDKGELPQVTKTKILAQWRLWMFDKNIHIMNMDTVEYMVPGKRKIVERERKPYAYKGDKYVVRYAGEIEINGNLYEYSTQYWNDKRTIHYFTAYYHTRENSITVALRCQNIYSTQDRSSNGIDIIHNGTQVLPKMQDGKSVFYYTNNSGNVQIQYEEVSDLGNTTKFRFYASTGSKVSDILLVHETEELQVGTSVECGLTNVLSSGIYLIKYLDEDDIWKSIESVVLIPEEIDNTHTIAGTNFTLEIHYLAQRDNFILI